MLTSFLLTMFSLQFGAERVVNSKFSQLLPHCSHIAALSDRRNKNVLPVIYIKIDQMGFAYSIISSSSHSFHFLFPVLLFWAATRQQHNMGSIFFIGLSQENLAPCPNCQVMSSVTGSGPFGLKTVLGSIPTSWISIFFALLGFEAHTRAIPLLIDTSLHNHHTCGPAVQLVFK